MPCALFLAFVKHSAHFLCRPSPYNLGAEPRLTPAHVHALEYSALGVCLCAEMVSRWSAHQGRRHSLSIAPCLRSLSIAPCLRVTERVRALSAVCPLSSPLCRAPSLNPVQPSAIHGLMLEKIEILNNMYPPPIRKLRAASQTDVLSPVDSGCWDSACRRPRSGRDRQLARLTRPPSGLPCQPPHTVSTICPQTSLTIAGTYTLRLRGCQEEYTHG